MEFLFRSFKLAHTEVAFQLKSNPLEGKGRYERIWSKPPIDIVLLLRGRRQIWKNGLAQKGGSSIIPFACNVWDRSIEGKPCIDWIAPHTNSDQTLLNGLG